MNREPMPFGVSLRTLQETPEVLTYKDLPSRRGKNITTPIGMRRFLIEMYGFTFVPKTRVITVPKEILETQKPYATYLARSAIIDQFSFDTAERNAWQKKQIGILPTHLFQSVYVTNNQFTGGSIAMVLGQTEYLAKKKYAGNTQLAHALFDALHRLHDIYAGPRPEDAVISQLTDSFRDSPIPHRRYAKNKNSEAESELANERYERLSIEEKLHIVHAYCDEIKQVLWLIAEHTQSALTPMSLRITGSLRHALPVLASAE